MKLSRLAARTVGFAVGAQDLTGAEAQVAEVAVVYLPRGLAPTPATSWTVATYADGVATVVLAGPDATGGTVVATSAVGRLWARVTAGGLVDVVELPDEIVLV